MFWWSQAFGACGLEKRSRMLRLTSEQAIKSVSVIVLVCEFVIGSCRQTGNRWSTLTRVPRLTEELIAAAEHY